MRAHLKKLGVASVAGLLVVAAANCGTSGELVVTATSDMSLPKDIDSVQLVVISRGQTQFSNKYQVGNGQLLIPATMGLLPGGDPSQPVTIRVIAWKGTQPVVLREAVTTIPTTRVANLRIPIEGLSVGSATTDGQVDPTTGDLQVGNACADGMTAVQGVCVDETVDQASLPEYDPTKVFGGGDGTGSGTCFDTAACMTGALPLRVNADCSFQFPAGADATHINFALASGTGGLGICVGDPADLTSAQGPCYLVLDNDPTDGWSNGQLPQGSPLPFDAGVQDGGATDGGTVPDAGVVDAGGFVDSGIPLDGGAPLDGSVQDGSVQDSGIQDGGVQDGGAKDAGPGTDAGAPDAGCTGDNCGPPQTGPTYYLPPGVCAQLQSGRFGGVVYSTACAAKTAGVPACGPWSSVGASAGSGGGGNDGGSSGTDGGASGCGPNQTMCGGLCTSTLSDMANCGACGIACSGGQVCLQGQCTNQNGVDAGAPACSGKGNSGGSGDGGIGCFSGESWNCGPTTYEVDCSCPAATCDCKKNQQVVATVPYAACPSCGSMTGLAAQCGFPE